ncbi:MAG TPA: alpha/beta hydrolase [Candidatus Eisenbacteria bacterium]
MKPLSLAICVMCAAGALQARAAVWQPSPGHRQIPIWPGSVPDAVPITKPEIVAQAENLVAGRPWLYVQEVAQPTMTVYSPRGTNTGAAVIVFPGGGYMILAIDLEGTEICEWLASRGITAVLLKYRVPASGPHWDSGCKCHKDPVAPLALEDAQRTLGLVRAHAAEWHVDPHKLGVLGFSAGGHLVADVSTHWSKRAYRAVDAADTQSCRPDFAVALYPGHMREHAAGEYGLNPRVPVTHETPPTFLLQAVDDPVDPVENSLVYFIALKRAGVSVEYHLYPRGGHAFGLRRTSSAITRWPELVETWLGTIGVAAVGAR